MATEAQLKALQKAAHSGDLGAVRCLVEEVGVSPNARSFYYPRSPLNLAEEQGHWEIVQYLLFLETEAGYALKTTLDSSQATMLQVASSLFMNEDNAAYRSPGGYCYGASSIMVNALLLQGGSDEKADNPLEEFYDRLNLIDALMLDAKRCAFQKAKTLYPPRGGLLGLIRTEPLMKKYKELTEQHVRMALAAKSPQCIDIRAFFETLEVHQQFDRYSGQLYSANENPEKHQNYKVSGRLFGSARLEKIGGMFELASLPIRCSRKELIDFFDKFKHIAVEGDPVCLTLSAYFPEQDVSHIITIGYDAARAQYIFNDINRFLPPDYDGREKIGPHYITDVSTLIGSITYSLLRDENQRKDFISGRKAYNFNVEVYTRKESPVMHSADEGVEQRKMALYPAFKAMLPVSEHLLGIQDHLHRLAVPYAYKHWCHTNKKNLTHLLLAGLFVLAASAGMLGAAFYFGLVFLPAVIAAAAILSLFAVCGMIYSVFAYCREDKKNSKDAHNLLASRVEKSRKKQAEKNLSSSAKTLQAMGDAIPVIPLSDLVPDCVLIVTKKDDDVPDNGEDFIPAQCPAAGMQTVH